jgi:DNA-binding Lrp family transcriptional regulator
MKDKNSKSHLADYVQAMMKSKADEFYDKAVLKDKAIPETRNTITPVKIRDIISAVHIPNGNRNDNSMGDAIGQPLGESTGEPIDIPIPSPNASPIVQAVKGSIVQPIAESIGQTVGDDHNEQNFPKEIVLNNTQYYLYRCIEEINGRLTNLVKISKATGISRDTLKSALKKLKETGAVLYHGRSNCLGLHGFTAEATGCPIRVVGDDRTQLDRKLRGIDFDSMCIDNQRSNIYNPHPMVHPLAHRLNHPFENSSSSFLNNKEPLLLREIEEYFDYHPDLLFWTDNHLTPQDVLKWLQEFDLTLEDMILYLSRCAFHILNDEALVLRKSPIDYFYGCIKKNEAYRIPKGYLTLEERRLADLKKQVEEKERIAKELIDLENRDKEATLQSRYVEMMANENGELYQRCFKEIPGIFKDDRTREGFKVAMKEALKKVSL